MTGPLLITGATGLIGRALMQRSGGLELVAVSRSGRPDWAAGLENVDWIEADLASADLAGSLPGKLEGIVHLARSRRQHEGAAGALDLFEVNVGSTARLLEHAAAAGAGRFVLASSASVYARSDEPLAEDAPLECPSLYAASKRSAELLVEAHADRVPGISLRIFTPYGPVQEIDLIADLVARVREGRPIEIQGRRGLLLSPIHADDVAGAILAALRLPEGDVDGAVNVGGPDRLDIGQAGALIGEALGIEPSFEHHDAAEPGGYLCDGALAASMLGLAPAAFAEGIAAALAGDP